MFQAVHAHLLNSDSQFGHGEKNITKEALFLAQRRTGGRWAGVRSPPRGCFGVGVVGGRSGRRVCRADGVFLRGFESCFPPQAFA